MTVRLWLSMLLLTAAVAAVGCHHNVRGGHNLPPAPRLMEPGPGVGGPGPGVLIPPPAFDPMLMGVPMEGMLGNVQVLFGRPEGMLVRWDVGGVGMYDSEPLVAPGRQEFPQGGIYNLKITNIRGREGIELYPSIEIGRSTPRTQAFFDHNAVPVQFTDEDFDQVLSGNFVTKVIYLPDPEFQELAQAGVDILVSTRLDPGLDPIVEADRRGAILAIVRLGNKDKERPGVIPGGIDVIPASYDPSVEQTGHHHGGRGGPMPAGACGPYGCPPGYGNVGGVIPSNVPGYNGFIHQPPVVHPHPYVAGVTTPQYGMPISGTPIGLPGPPHIPLGIPAGLQKHTIKNHTHMHIPPPTSHVGIHVKQTPGMSYPAPASQVRIHEQSIHATNTFHQPHAMKWQEVPGGYGAGAMPGGPGGFGGGFDPNCPPGH